MKRHPNCKRAGASAGLILAAFTPAIAQMPDMAAAAKWENAVIIHYEAVGEVSAKHVQIPPVDADLYADVTDKVTLSFDWDKNKQAFVGAPTFKNYPGAATNLSGMDKGCPTGNLAGAYEHFDIISVSANNDGAIVLTGKRVHPDTMVAESCGASLKPYKGADEPRTEYMGAPDPTVLAFGSMLPADSPFQVSPDGKSLIMKSFGAGWVWTITPSVK